MSNRAKLVWFPLTALAISLVITPAFAVEDAWEALVKGGHGARIRHGNAPPVFVGDKSGGEEHCQRTGGQQPQQPKSGKEG